MVIDDNQAGAPRMTPNEAENAVRPALPGRVGPAPAVSPEDARAAAVLPGVPPSPARFRWWRWTAWVVTAAALVYLVASGRLSPDAVRVRPGGWGWLAAGVGTIWFALALTILRFGLVARGAGLPLAWRSFVSIGMAGMFFNLVGPGGVGGDLARAGFLAGASRRRGASLAASLMDRILGLYALAIAGSIAVAAQAALFRATPALWPTAFVLLGVFAGMTGGLALAAWGGPAMVRTLAARSWPGTRILARLAEAMLVYKHAGGTLAAGLGLSLAFYGLQAAGLGLLGRGLALASPPPWMLTATATPVAFLANTLPAPGGGLGVGEAVFDEVARMLSSADGAAGWEGGAALFLGYRFVSALFSLAGLPFAAGLGGRGRATGTPVALIDSPSGSQGVDGP